MDDFCGTYSINPSDLNIWEPVKKDIENLIQKNVIKTIVACRLQVYMMKSLNFIKIERNVCNLLSKGLRLSHTENTVYHRHRKLGTNEAERNRKKK